MIQYLAPIALEGGKRAAATFGGKFITAIAGYSLGKAANKGLDKLAEKKEKDPSKARKPIVEAVGAAVGAVAFSTADEIWISK